MTQDEIIEIAINAGFSVDADTRQIYIEFGDGYRSDITEKLVKIAEIIQSQAQPTPSQSEPFAYIHRNEYDEYRLEPLEPFKIKAIPKNTEILLYTNSQPTSQDVVDAERYRWLANNCDGNAQDDFIQWLSTVVATRADIDESIDAAMIESKT